MPFEFELQSRPPDKRRYLRGKGATEHAKRPGVRREAIAPRRFGWEGASDSRSDSCLVDGVACLRKRRGAIASPRTPKRFAQSVLAVFCALLVVYACRAQASSFHPLIENGPDSNRVDIVFLSEGYTSSQLFRFLGDVTNVFQGLLTHQPLASYKRHFNASAIFVASAQSGSDHPVSGISRNTYFNSAYDSYTDFIITIPLNNQGQGRVDALVQEHKPTADCVILLVNDSYPGGSDGFGRLAIASVAAASADILAHEIGHVLAGLGDEYDAPYPGFPDVEEPNTTRETRREFVKWKDWIAPSTPVPTPPLFQYEQAVGLFEGAHYHSSGWYRPKFDCKMNHYRVPFCEVCSEALVLAIYRKVRPIEAFMPAGAWIQVQSAAPLAFSIDLLHPEPGPLTVQWSTNGAPVQGATNSAFLALPGNLAPGTNLLSATVFDATPLVRTDPEDLRRQTVSWTLNVNRVEVRLEDPLLLPDGRFVVKVTGAPDGTVIQSSADLVEWASSYTNHAAGGSFYYTNAPSPGAGQILLRALVR